MKQILFKLTLLVSGLTPMLSSAQQAPYDMMVNGVKVIVHPSGNEIVVVQTIIKGGVQNYPANKAGIEALALSALTECGTAKDDKNSFKNKLDKVTAYVYGSTALDKSNVNLNCIKSDIGTVWPLYVDALTTPKFDNTEFERIKQDAINAIRANESNPDNAIDKLAKQTAFAGKGYAKDPEGSVDVISKISSGEAKKYWQSILTRNRMVIVVVADLDKALIEQMVKELTAKIPVGPKFELKKEAFVPTSTTFKPVERENATNYVQGLTSAPLPGTADYNAYYLAMQIFSTRHFIEIRTKNGLSYAPGIWTGGGTTTFGNIYVTTTDPDKYIAVARGLIDRIKQEGFTEAELKNEKTKYLTGVHYRNETNEALATSLGNNEVIHGNWKRSINITNDINKVTLAQLNAAFNKYMNHITWVYQGDPKKVNPVLFTQKATPPVPEEKKAF